MKFLFINIKIKNRVPTAINGSGFHEIITSLTLCKFIVYVKFIITNISSTLTHKRTLDDKNNEYNTYYNKYNKKGNELSLYICTV